MELNSEHLSIVNLHFVPVPSAVRLLPEVRGRVVLYYSSSGLASIYGMLGSQQVQVALATNRSLASFMHCPLLLKA